MPKQSGGLGAVLMQFSALLAPDKSSNMKSVDVAHLVKLMFHDDGDSEHEDKDDDDND